jgi:RNA ligase (TIGR02306 family)
VQKIYDHPNADKLVFLEVAGWRCIASKGSVEKGDWGAYFPIDSVLTPEIMNAAFKDAKIQPQKGRVRTVKIRGEIAQGLFLPASLLPVFPCYPQEGQCLAEVLGVTKYEPPQASIPVHMQTDKKGTRKKANTNFKEYTDLQHLRWNLNRFTEGETVVFTEKIHGTSARYGRVPVQPDTFWKKLKKLVGLLDSHEWVYGSRKVQLQSKKHRTTSYYGTDVWLRCAEKYKLADLLLDDEVVYGEIYGGGIQKGYDYGVSAEDRSFVVYDVQKDGKFLDHADLVHWCRSKQIPMVPTLYTGPFSVAAVDEYTNGASVLDPNTKIREGIVVRPSQERHGLNGRDVVKSVSPAFLLGDNTDFH